MLSSSSLLILLLFAVRRRSKKAASLLTKTEATSPFPDLSGLETLMPKINPISIPVREIKEAQPSSDLIELINRYGFFQGKNLERFTAFAQENNWEKIEQLILEKFQAQGKNNPEQFAQEISRKLIGLHS
jgi:hypothetical protein